MSPTAYMPDFRPLRAVGTWIAIATLMAFVAGCASRSRAPIEDRSPKATAPVAAPAPAPPAAVEEKESRPQTYTVKRGDTLYAIALDQGLDYRELAAWNNIENVNVIRVGQVLRIVAPGDPAALGPAAVQTMPLRPAAPVVSGAAPASPGAAAPSGPTSRNTDNYKAQPKAIKEPYSETALRDVQQRSANMAADAPAPAESPPPTVVASIEPRTEPKPEAKPEPRPAAPPDDDGGKLDWVWPAKGKVVAGFSEATSLKGIDIAGAAGQTIAASAGGKVVYAGTGLRGYGKLIIIKHNGIYLSAYAHNREILVKEGQQVVKGQKIAEMGNTDTEQVKLHFEIRRQGKPVDPLRYLPPA